MYVAAYKHARLMDESEWRIEVAADSALPEEWAAPRVLASPRAYRHWRGEHSQLIRSVSGHTSVERQVVQLRSTMLTLVHRKAIFEYLQERTLIGRKRRRLFEIFYGCRDYTNAVLTEHGNYVRCSSSYLCAQHLAEHLMHDTAAAGPVGLYEERYREYFRAYCDGELAQTEEERLRAEPLDALRPLLKYQITEARQHILSMPLAPQHEWSEVLIRRPTGQTERLRVLSGRVNR